LKFSLTNGESSANLDLFEKDMLSSYKKLRNKFLKLGFIVRGGDKKHKRKISLFRDGEKIKLRSKL
jgi:hypothetical protein